MLLLKQIGKLSKFNLRDKSNLDMIKKLRFFGQSKKLAKVLIDKIK
jgi:hypothetical protein